MRSQWKIPFFSYKFLKKSVASVQNTSLRSQMVLPSLVDKVLFIYSGRVVVRTTTLIYAMLGHKLGEFSFSRGVFQHKKKMLTKIRSKEKKK